MSVSERHEQVFGKRDRIPAVAPSADKKLGLFSDELTPKIQDQLPAYEQTKKLPEIGKKYEYYKVILPNANSFPPGNFNDDVKFTMTKESNAAKQVTNDNRLKRPEINYRKAMEPKVMLPFQTKPGQTPRKIEIERKKRTYSSKNITDLVFAKLEDLKSRKILPENTFHSKKKAATLATSGGDVGVFDPLNAPLVPVIDISHFLPLEYFDNTEYDCRTSNDWLDMRTAPELGRKAPTLFPIKENGLKKGNSIIKYAMVPLPAKAFDGLDWYDCIAIAHDPRNNSWKVKWRGYNGWELDKPNGEDEREIHAEDESLIEEIEMSKGDPKSIIDGKEMWVNR
jgi:dynein heavy chain